MRERERIALFAAVACVATIACASFVCGLILMLIGTFIHPTNWSWLSDAFGFAAFGTLAFGIPTAFVSSAIIWFTFPRLRAPDQKPPNPDASAQL